MFDAMGKIKNQVKDALSRFERIVSIGTVSAVDSDLKRVKVTFKHDDIPESDWLSVVGGRAHGVSVSFNLEPGEQVLCFFPPVGSMMRGYVLGSLVNKKSTPYTNNADVFGVKFKDGTIIEYNQDESVGRILIAGKSPSIEINKTKLKIIGDVEIDGKLSVTKAANLDGGVVILNSATLNGESVSTDNHYHNEHDGPSTSPAKGSS